MFEEDFDLAFCTLLLACHDIHSISRITHIDGVDLLIHYQTKYH